MIFSYEEFLAIQEDLDSYDDLRVLREAKEKEGEAPTMSLEDVKKELNVE